MTQKGCGRFWTFHAADPERQGGVKDRINLDGKGCPVFNILVGDIVDIKQAVGLITGFQVVYFG